MANESECDTDGEDTFTADMLSDMAAWVHGKKGQVFDNDRANATAGHIMRLIELASKLLESQDLLDKELKVSGTLREKTADMNDQLIAKNTEVEDLKRQLEGAEKDKEDLIRRLKEGKEVDTKSEVDNKRLRAALRGSKAREESYRMEIKAQREASSRREEALREELAQKDAVWEEEEAKHSS